MSSSPTRAFESKEQPTSPLPTVTLFDLLTETRRLDAAAQAPDSERTLVVAPEENERLLASVLAHSDDEPTLMAPAPAPPLSLSLFPAPRQRVAERATPISGICERIRPDVGRAARDDRSAAWLPKGTRETCLVAGIWVMALSLLALLTLLATSA
jgi:hypothetical protein